MPENVRRVQLLNRAREFLANCAFDDAAALLGELLTEAEVMHQLLTEPGAMPSDVPQRLLCDHCESPLAPGEPVIKVHRWYTQAWCMACACREDLVRPVPDSPPSLPPEGT